MIRELQDFGNIIQMLVASKEKVMDTQVSLIFNELLCSLQKSLDDCLSFIYGLTILRLFYGKDRNLIFKKSDNKLNATLKLQVIKPVPSQFFVHWMQPVSLAVRIQL